MSAPWFKWVASTIDYGRVLVLDALVPQQLGDLAAAQSDEATPQPQEWRSERDPQSGLAWHASFDGNDLVVIVDSDRPDAVGTVVEVVPLGDAGELKRESIELTGRRSGGAIGRVDFRGVSPAEFRNILLKGE